jgi:hypothetical protein
MEVLEMKTFRKPDKTLRPTRDSSSLKSFPSAQPAAFVLSGIGLACSVKSVQSVAKNAF